MLYLGELPVRIAACVCHIGLERAGVILRWILMLTSSPRRIRLLAAVSLRKLRSPPFRDGTSRRRSEFTSLCSDASFSQRRGRGCAYAFLATRGLGCVLANSGRLCFSPFSSVFQHCPRRHRHHRCHCHRRHRHHHVAILAQVFSSSSVFIVGLCLASHLFTLFVKAAIPQPSSSLADFSIPVTPKATAASRMAKDQSDDEEDYWCVAEYQRVH